MEINVFASKSKRGEGWSLSDWQVIENGKWIVVGFPDTNNAGACVFTVLLILLKGWLTQTILI